MMEGLTNKTVITLLLNECTIVPGVRPGRDKLLLVCLVQFLKKRPKDLVELLVQSLGSIFFLYLNRKDAIKIF
jgi:hypothetical protein